MTAKTDRFIRIDCADRADWLDKRKSGLGGSDAACILGLNPWKTNLQLWEEKTGRKQAPDIGNVEAVQYGHDAEGPLRELFALDFPEFTVEHHEDQLLRSTALPWMQASLDGELTDTDCRRGILEIKTTRIASSMQKESWAGQVPQNYYCQLLHYLLVTGYEFAILKAQLKYDYGKEGLKLVTRHYHFERAGLEADLRMLLKAEIEFWEMIRTDKRPGLILPSI